MTTDGTHLIVGASLAGAKAAEALRAEGFDGPLVLIGDESDRPYERPPLSPLPPVPSRSSRKGQADLWQQARHAQLRGGPVRRGSCAWRVLCLPACAR